MNLVGVLITALLMQQPQGGTIEGTVVNVGTTQPVARALVQVVGATKAASYVVETGADGKFQFQNLPRGQYQIKVSRTGYMDGAFGQRSPNGQSRSIPIEAGQVLRDVRVTMIPLGAISGRLYDDRGEPIANVNVQALKYSYQNGQASLKAVKSALTNDRGEYRLFWLPPGEYYVSAIASNWQVNVMLQVVLREGPTGPVAINGPLGADLRPVDTYAPVYYPGTPEVRAATLVGVRAGADVAGIDFTLVRVVPRKIRGTVVDGTTGRAAKSNSLILVPRNGSITGPAPVRPKADGTFEIQEILPGPYFLIATSAGGDSRVAGGRVALDVANADLDGITVPLFPGIDIPATIDGLRGTPPAELYPSIALKDETPFPRTTAWGTASFKNAREFTVEDVIEGDYHLQIMDIPTGTYVKSARFGAVDVLNDSIHVDSRTSERLEIVLGTDVGTLEGTVADRARNPVANASIALLPFNVRYDRPDLYRKASTDQSGRFQLRDVAPGEYMIFTWEDVDESVWRDPEFIRRNEAAGRRVRVGPNSRDTLELTAIPLSF
jgi:hypothetical protein